jgi:hypothetical protein
MTFTDWLAIYAAFIGTIGTVLSVILGIREINKEKRELKVYIERNVWLYYAYLKIVNTGHRPVTIKRIVATRYVLKDGKKVGAEYIRPGHCFKLEDLDKLPLILEDGEQVSLEFSEIVSGFLTSEDYSMEVSVFDAEERAYKQGTTVVLVEKPA